MASHERGVEAHEDRTILFQHLFIHIAYAYSDGAAICAAMCLIFWELDTLTLLLVGWIEMQSAACCGYYTLPVVSTISLTWKALIEETSLLFLWGRTQYIQTTFKWGHPHSLMVWTLNITTISETMWNIYIYSIIKYNIITCNII